MKVVTSVRIVRVGLAFAVAFWMAGAGCLLGCENMLSAAAAAPAATSSLTVIAAEDACASMHAHDCCAKHGRKATAHSASKPASKPAVASKFPASTSNTRAVELSATYSTMMDCPLAVNATAALSKAKPDTSKVILAHSPAVATVPQLKEHATALFSRHLLPNRGHTYLRHCVFLI